MSGVVLKILGVADGRGGSPSASEWLRAVGPLFVPFLTLVAVDRSEVAMVAAVWAVILVPGLLATNLLFPSGGAFDSCLSRFGVASVLGLLPFAISAWLGCAFHWTLPSVWFICGILYLLAIAGLAHVLAHRKACAILYVEPASRGGCDGYLPRWLAVGVILAIAVIMVAVHYSCPPADIASNARRYLPAARPGWWHGIALGGVGSVLASIVLFFFVKTPRACGPAIAATEIDLSSKLESLPKRSRRAKPQAKHVSTARTRQFNWEPYLTSLLWLATIVLTVFIMKVTYGAWVPDMEKGTKGVLIWNVDDVAYVSEAVDYRYGLPLGLHESSVGGDSRLRRATMSPLMAPLVATISSITGVSCAALHHSVMPPLMVLMGTSCLAAALQVVFRKDRWLVPLGLVIALIMVVKSWDYARCVVEMLVFRAMQTKAQHLAFILPLQLAGMILVARAPKAGNLLFAVVVAIVGHVIHPFSTITGMVWSTIMVLSSLIGRRQASVKLLAIMIVYCALGGIFREFNHRTNVGHGLSSGRAPGSPIQSRDLVRVDRLVFSLPSELREDLETGELSSSVRKEFAENGLRLSAKAVIEHQGEEDGWVIAAGNTAYRIRDEEGEFMVYQVSGKPSTKLDPFWSFGQNTLFTLATLTVPIAIVFGRRRKEILVVGLLGAGVLVTTHFEPLGKLLNVALPTSIMWRSRWMVPQLVNASIIAVVLYYAVSSLLARVDGKDSPWRSFLSAMVVVASFCVMVSCTTSVMLKVGDPPTNLDKFSEGSGQLVELLGGVEAAPFVWGSFLVHHELPQLMPNVKLVFSRDKLMRQVDHPKYRSLVLGVFSLFNNGTVKREQFEALLQLYPIDHVVLDYRYRNRNGPKAMLQEMGWIRVGVARPSYEVWKSPTAPQSRAVGRGG